jgi:pimeloyl-ACP methyl ester carboxylesterase
MGCERLPRTTIKKVISVEAEHPAAAIAEGTVCSADGTRIGFRRLGSGPAIMMVHGSVSTHTDWLPAARLLASRYTCYVMDRRGRRSSGAGHAPYAIEREIEDICAVLETAEVEAVKLEAAELDAAGGQAVLAGHSYGAICALGAALRRPVSKLILYEPPLPVGGAIAGAALAAYARAVSEGRLEEAMEIGLREFTRLRPQVIAAIRASRGWPKLCKLAPTWTRELEAMDAEPASVEHYGALACPVLMLVGTLSPEHPFQMATRALACTLPDVRVEALAGQDHLGLRGAPQLIARAMAEFLAG